jgi:hypothetical protein
LAILAILFFSSMIQPTLTRRIEDALQALDAASPLVEMLAALEVMHQHIDTHLNGMTEGSSQDISGNAHAVHSKLTSLSTITKTLSARKLFREVEVLEGRLSKALKDGLDETKYVVEFLGILDEFAEAYNAYVVNQTGKNALPLLFIARRLTQAFSSFQGFLEYILANSSYILSRREDEAEFSLVLANVTDVQNFSEKLAALNALYLEICYLLGVSVPSHPLRIGKIESGSLWTNLFGETRVVGLMNSLIEGGVHFFHRNYTKEGKIAAIPKKLESLNELLDFSNRLKESGCDVTEIQEKIAKGAAIITDNLNTLLSDQPVVEVNGKTLSIGQELQKALLEQIAIQKIGYAPSADPVPGLKPLDQT